MAEIEIEKKLISGVKFGGFRNKHYKEAVNDKFKSIVLKYIKEEIVLSKNIEFDKVEGKVYAPHDNEAKGQHKAYKNKFAFCGKFYQGRLFNEINFGFFYKPDNDHIKMWKEPFIYTIEMRKQDNLHSKMINDIVHKFLLGHKDIICLKCFERLDLYVLKEQSLLFLKSINCHNGCFGMVFHGLGIPKTRLWKLLWVFEKLSGSYQNWLWRS